MKSNLEVIFTKKQAEKFLSKFSYISSLTQEAFINGECDFGIFDSEYNCIVKLSCDKHRKRSKNAKSAFKLTFPAIKERKYIYLFYGWKYKLNLNKR
ncbi:MAG: hypothetical protein ACFFDN_00920 [Candidatus Hodarchaeota archaeon]